MHQLNTVLPAIFNRIRPGATFMSVMNYENNHKELSNFGIVFHVNYINAVKKSLAIWQDMEPKTYLEKVARAQLIESYTDTLNGFNPRATSARAYDQIVDGDGNLIKGVKLHYGEVALHLWGFLVHRRIIRPGEYPQIMSSALTLVKRSLKKKTPLFRFRQFKLVPGRFGKISVEKLSLEQKDLIKELV